jgi:hypothetical protein
MSCCKAWDGDLRLVVEWEGSSAIRHPERLVHSDGSLAYVTVLAALIMQLLLEYPRMDLFSYRIIFEPI